MTNLTISKSDLRELVTESVRGALSEELMKFRALALPAVSQREQREIERSLSKADRSVGKKIRITL